MHHWVEAQTPRGTRTWFGVREGTADGALLGGVIGDDEYRLADLPEPLDGWALDVGSYAGHVASALLADFPGLRVVAIDPVRENCDILRDARNNRYDGRLVVIEGAATDACRPVSLQYNYTSGPADHDYVHDNRFMAGLWRQGGARGDGITVDGWTIRALLDHAKADRFSFVKIDCEGCEYQFFASPDVDLLDYIVGEFHDGGPERIQELLTPTHVVEILEDHGGTGIFRAIHR